MAVVESTFREARTGSTTFYLDHLYRIKQQSDKWFGCWSYVTDGQTGVFSTYIFFSFYTERLKCKAQIRFHERYVFILLHEEQIKKFSNSKCSISASEHFTIRNITDSFIRILGVFWKYKGKGKGNYPCLSQEGIGGNRAIVPLICSLGTSWEWAVSFRPRPFYPRNEPRSHWGWVDPELIWTFLGIEKNFSLTWIRAPDRSLVAISTTPLRFLLKVYTMIISYVPMVLKYVRCNLIHFNTYFSCVFRCCDSITRMY